MMRVDDVLAPDVSLIHSRQTRGLWPRGTKLAADSQPLDQRLVATLVSTGEIIEQLAALRYELEQSTPGMVVLDVALEVLGQIVDAFRKNGHLHLRRSSVAGLGRIGLDDFRLACGRNRHRAFLSLTSLLAAVRVRPGRDVVQRGHGISAGQKAPRTGEI